MLANVGAEPPRPSAHGLLGTTLHAWPGSRAFALEGAIFQAGSIVRWLRDKLGLIGGADEVEALARRADPRAEVMLVPAFTGLGAPWWDADARGQLSGLTLDAGAPEIAYAALEAVAFQTRDLVEAMAADSGVTPAALRVDGGMTANDMLMQMIADQLALPVDRPKVAETTALGAAWLAARGVDLPMDSPVGEPPGGLDRRFTPGAGAADRDRRHRLWRAAVERVRTVDRGASNRTP
jgi:glycerol kinase